MSGHTNNVVSMFVDGQYLYSSDEITVKRWYLSMLPAPDLPKSTKTTVTTSVSSTIKETTATSTITVSEYESILPIVSHAMIRTAPSTTMTSHSNPSRDTQPALLPWVISIGAIGLVILALVISNLICMYHNIDKRKTRRMAKDEIEWHKQLLV